MIVMPWIAKSTGMDDLVAGAWLGGTLDTSASVVAAGALISDAAMKTGVIVKFSQNALIGVAAFMLAIWWAFKLRATSGERPSASVIWERFPKFVLGFVATFLIVFVIALASEAYQKPLSAAMNEANVFRQIFFLLTFFAIGLMADLRKLWQEGIGKLAAVYVICLFGFIIWVGLIISWVFFHGVQPPIASG
jgi:uncharacterized membrane protein YadS